jgi:hypothetical protein
MDDEARSLIEFNDEKLARFMFGDNAQTGTLRLLLWIAGFVAVIGGIFHLLRSGI